MYVTLQTFEKVLAPYLLVAAGFGAGKLINVRKESFAQILIYFLSPVVVFAAVTKATLDLRFASLPFLFFALCSLVGVISLFLGQFFYNPPKSNLLGFACGNGNSGYFGIPVGIALFGDQALPAIVLCSFGFILYENTVGFYITALGKHSPLEALARVVRLPAVYAFAAGVAANFFGLPLAGPWLDLTISIRGAYSVLGMMLIGLAIAELRTFAVDWPFTGLACVIKFVFWPALLLLLLTWDQSMLHLFSAELRPVLFFMATVPLAANTVAIATLLQVEPERAAVAVLVSTIAALPIVPLLNGWFLSL